MADQFQKQKSPSSIFSNDNSILHYAARMFFENFEKDGRIKSIDIKQLLTANGLLNDDPRFSDLYKELDNVIDLDKETFLTLMKKQRTILERAFRGELTVPDFDVFRNEVHELYKNVKAMKDEGHVAQYIPHLACVNPNYFAVSICTVDGQRFDIGDAQIPFCIQSCCKPINYCFALEEVGSEKVHKHIGREPSGVQFNSLCLNGKGLPHNPLINSGAIMACSLIKSRETNYKRFDHVVTQWTDLCGGRRPGFNNSVYLSEKDTADANFCLGYMMRKTNAFPEHTNLQETLDFYFQCCSIEVTCSNLAIAAATLAKGGVCPLTNKVIFKKETCRDVLSLMYSCGMYDYSGEWAFSTGLCAKSGVSGCIFVVIPNFGGISIWAPPLDPIGNSWKGVQFFKKLVDRFNFHTFDQLIDHHETLKRDPRTKAGSDKRRFQIEALFAAAEGDTFELKRLLAAGVDVNGYNYDKRTCLHVAAAEGHSDVVKLLIKHHADVNAVDRWGNTPMSEAKNGDYKEIVKLLKAFGAVNEHLVTVKGEKGKEVEAAGEKERMKRGSSLHLNLFGPKSS